MAADTARLWDAYHVRIFRYIRSKVDDVELSQDLQAEVYSRAVSAEKRGIGPDPDGYPHSWLYRIAHNVLVDYYRARDRRPLAVELEEAIDLPSQLPSPQRIAEASEQRDRLHRAMQSLTENQRTVVYLQMHGYRHDEIGALMGKSVQAVKGLRHRAWSALQDFFAEEHEATQ